MKLPEHIRLGFFREKKGESPHYLKQVHGREVVAISDGVHWQKLLEEPVEADAAWTRTPGVVLKVQTADCIPVLLFTEEADGPIAAIHAGWRGVAKGIVEEAMRHFPQNSTCAWIGPAIQSCHFEVRSDLVESFRKEGRPCEKYLTPFEDRFRMDLVRMLLETQLASISQSRLFLADHRCTYCSDLPSYRRSGGTEERIVSWITRLS